MGMYQVWKRWWGWEPPEDVSYFADEETMARIEELDVAERLNEKFSDWFGSDMNTYIDEIEEILYDSGHHSRNMRDNLSVARRELGQIWHYSFEFSKSLVGLIAYLGGILTILLVPRKILLPPLVRLVWNLSRAERSNTLKNHYLLTRGNRVRFHYREEE